MSAGSQGGPGRGAKDLKPFPIFWSKVKKAMERKGISQSKLGNHLGVLSNRLTKWLRHGQGVPDIHQAQRIAAFLEVPLDWLLNDDEQGRPPTPEERQSGLSHEVENERSRGENWIGIENGAANDRILMRSCLDWARMIYGTEARP